MAQLVFLIVVLQFYWFCALLSSFKVLILHGVFAPGLRAANITPRGRTYKSEVTGGLVLEERGIEARWRVTPPFSLVCCSCV